MEVECVFYGPLREAVGAKTVAVDPKPTTIAGLLDELEERYPEFAGLVRDGGGFGDEAVVTVNGRHADHAAGLDTPLSDGDVVRLTTAIYGG
jgi:MoaD family protein